MTLLHVIHPIPIVSITISIIVNTMTFLVIVHPISFISFTVLICKNSKSVKIVILPFSLVELAIVPDHSSFTWLLIVQPVSFIYVTVLRNISALSLPRCGANKTFSYVSAQNKLVSPFSLSVLFLFVWFIVESPEFYL